MLELQLTSICFSTRGHLINAQMVKRIGIPFRYSYDSVYLIIIPVITNINNNHNETAMSKHPISFLTIARRFVMFELV